MTDTPRSPYPPDPSLQTDPFAAGGAHESGVGGSDRTRDVAKDEAASVADDAKTGAKEVASTAKEQASNVASEAKTQARQMFHQTKGELTDQASTQQARAATGLSSLADELHQMAERSDGGIASDAVRQAGDRARSAAQWLEAREPGDVLSEVTRFARQRPGAFLAAAAALGLVGGRLTRSLVDDARDDDDTSERGYERTAYDRTGYGRGYADHAAYGGTTTGRADSYGDRFADIDEPGRAGTSWQDATETSTGYTTPPPPQERR